jgi:hypothetical protein
MITFEFPQFVTEKIFSLGERILTSIEGLPEILAKENIPLPSEYDGSKKGGYLSLYQKSELITTGELIMLGKLGIIDPIPDNEYGCKSNKYRDFAEKKCQAIIQTPGAKKSNQTTFGIRGGIILNDWLALGFSGRSQFEDDLLVVATSMKYRSQLQVAFGATNNQFSHFKDENPFLTEDILHAIYKHIDVKH